MLWQSFGTSDKTHLAEKSGEKKNHLIISATIKPATNDRKSEKPQQKADSRTIQVPH